MGLDSRKVLGPEFSANMLQLGATLLVWASIGAFQATCASKYSSVPEIPCGPGKPCASGQVYRPPKPLYKRPFLSDSSVPCGPDKPCAPTKVFYPPKRVHKRPPPPAKFSYKKPCSKDIVCVNDFVSTFIAEAMSCDSLRDLFEYFNDVSGVEFCNGKFPEFLEAFSDCRAPNADFAAQQAVEEIGECFRMLDCEIVAHVYANWIAKYLFTQGVLNPNNAVHLAKKYIDELKEAANCNDSPYAALREGFVDFLDSLGLFTPDKVLLIALQYRNEWQLQAKF